MRAFKSPIKVSCRGSKGRRINRDVKGESIGVSRDFFRGGDFSQIKTLHKSKPFSAKTTLSFLKTQLHWWVLASVCKSLPRKHRIKAKPNQFSSASSTGISKVIIQGNIKNSPLDLVVTKHPDMLKTFCMRLT